MIKILLNSFFLFFFLISISSIGDFFNKFLLQKNDNKFLLSFSLGFIFFLLIFFSIYLISFNALASKYLSLFAIFFVANYLLKKKIKINLKTSILFFLGILFFSLFNFVVWKPNNLDIYNVYASFGSLHVNKYIGIYEYIRTCNVLPFINQDYSNSLLTYLLNFFNLENIFSFNLTLSFFQVIFVLAIYDFLSFLKVKNKILSTFVFMLSATSLSLSFFVINDSGFPFISIGYASIYLGLILSLCLIYLGSIDSYLNEKLFKLTEVMLLLFLFIIAPHFLILIFSSYIFSRKINFYQILTLLFAFLFYSLFIGGMFSFQSFKEFNYIPGVQNFSIEKSINFVPFIPFKIYAQGDGFGQDLLALLNKAFFNKIHYGNFILENFLIGIKLLLISFWVLMYPYLAIIFGYFKYNLNFNKFFIKSALISILLGFLFSFPFQINGFKWELSRFNLLGVMFGILILIFFIDKVTSSKAKYALFLILIFPYLFNFQYNRPVFDTNSFIQNNKISC